MSTVYAFTTPARGHLYPLTPILAELARRGHRVKVWTLADQLDHLRDAGIEAEAISPKIEALPVNDWEARSPWQGNVNTLRRFLARAPHEVAELQRAIAVRRPDLLLTDINAWGAPAAAEASGIPWATFAPFFSWLPSADVPVFGPGMRPRGGPLGRARNAALWKLVEFDLNRRFLADLNAVRRDTGAGPLRTLPDLWRRPPRLLYMTLPELDYRRREWPASFRFVGPCNWEPDAAVPDWLAADERPLILVTASSEYQNDEALVATALAALAEEQATVVATTAGADPAAFDPPPNARVERFLPHRPLLARAEVVVCHGGMGIVQKSLAAGVPLCVIGWGRDQLEAGRRVEAAGAGILVSRKKLTPQRLRDAVHRARELRPGAERLAAAIAACPGPARAADELESLLS
jgi:MGT family glycosyltransferase